MKINLLLCVFVLYLLNVGIINIHNIKYCYLIEKNYCLLFIIINNKIIKKIINKISENY